MSQYKVVYGYTTFEEETIEADSFDEAQSKWEDRGYDDADIFIIENENGEQLVF